MRVFSRFVATLFARITKLVFVFVLLVSLALNVTFYSAGVVAMTISTFIEATTGFSTAALQLLRTEERVSAISSELSILKTKASRFEGAAIVKSYELEKARGRLVAKSKELFEASKAATAWKVAALEKARLLEKERLGFLASKSELAALKAERRAIVSSSDGVVQKAVVQITGRVKARMAKLAAADLAATFGQAIPWIGIGVVVAATAYDLKSTCDTMKDMHDLNLVFNPAEPDDPAVAQVCGLRVPTL